ncbi:gp53-like domain-containing protein [Klebsiella pneumoniae]|uniref:gp53-like domain-containing protein n=2 Tax=Klebsiella pneumoniae TaxID=573 RepID=UPI0025A288E6|nr:hypothetical protein [Klebsiella pneumoniae]MDM7291706.1 hypothetical protein [Klebsiella pneumoniae]
MAIKHGLNVRLGEAAKLDANTGTLTMPGWASLPLLGGRKFLIQWGTGRTPTGSFSYNCDITFPISFPVTCLSVLCGSGVQTADLDKVARYRTLKQEVTFSMASQKGVQAQLLLSDESTQDGRFFYWMAIGYCFRVIVQVCLAAYNVAVRSNGEW